MGAPTTQAYQVWDASRDTPLQLVFGSGLEVFENTQVNILNVNVKSPGEGSGGRVAFWTSNYTLGKNDNFQFDASNSQVLVGDGTLSNPSYSFVSNKTMGFLKSTPITIRLISPQFQITGSVQTDIGITTFLCSQIYNFTASGLNYTGASIVPTFGSSTSSIGNAVLVNLQLQKSSFGGPITTYIGFRALSPTAGGIVSSAANVALANLTLATNNSNLVIGQTTIPSGNWSLYSSSSYDSYFAGSYFGLGTITFPSGGGTPALIFNQASGNPTGLGSNTAGLFAKDVAGTCEMFAIDEAGAVNQISAHYFGPMVNLDRDDLFPWVAYSEHLHLGIKRAIYLSKMARALEKLTGEKYITDEFMPRVDWTSKKPMPKWMKERLNAIA